MITKNKIILVCNHTKNYEISMKLKSEMLVKSSMGSQGKVKVCEYRE